MNRRIFIAAAAVLGSTLALPASPAAAQDISSCESQYYDDCLPCEWDDSLFAGDPDCAPPCEYDPGIPASSPYCDPCAYPDSSTIDPSCEEPTTTTTGRSTGGRWCTDTSPSMSRPTMRACTSSNSAAPARGPKR